MISDKLINKYLVMFLEGLFYFALPIIIWNLDSSGFPSLLSFGTYVYISFVVGVLAVLLYPDFARFKAMVITLELIIIMAFYIGLTCVGDACMAQIAVYMETFSFAAIFNGILIGFLIRKIIPFCRKLQISQKAENTIQLFNPKSKIKYFLMLLEAIFYLIIPCIIWSFDSSGFTNPIAPGNYAYLSFGIGAVSFLLWPSVSRFKSMAIAFELIIIIAFYIGLICGADDCTYTTFKIYGEAFSLAIIFNGALVGFFIRKTLIKMKVLKF
jgi:hypothetical protein